MSALTSPAKRRGWYWLLDQVVSSLSNGLILFAVAVVSTAEDFGLIPLLLMLLTAGVGCMRGALGTPLLLKAADGIDHIRRGGVLRGNRSIGGQSSTGGRYVAVAQGSRAWNTDHPHRNRHTSGDGAGRPAIRRHLGRPAARCRDLGRILVSRLGGPAGVDMGGHQIRRCQRPHRGLDRAGGRRTPRSRHQPALAARFRGFFRWLATGWQHRLRYGIHAGLEQGGLFIAMALVTFVVGPLATAALRGAMALMAPLAILTSALRSSWYRKARGVPRRASRFGVA